jgi:hypothetical protein
MAEVGIDELRMITSATCELSRVILGVNSWVERSVSASEDITEIPAEVMAFNEIAMTHLLTEMPLPSSP